jgi:hypothetical protein
MNELKEIGNFDMLVYYDRGFKKIRVTDKKSLSGFIKAI